jgi:thioredoxin reductase
MHCFLSRDGISPNEFLHLAREQLRAYPSTELREALVLDATRHEDAFEVTLHNGERHSSRKLLLATGVVDHLPAVNGIEQLYGRSVHHCPYCDGWECRDKPIGVYGRAEKGAGLALMLKQWSTDVMLFTDGPTEFSSAHRSRLARERIEVYQERIAHLEGTPDGQLERVVLATGTAIPRRALFFNTGQHQRSSLAARLGCEFTERGGISVTDYDVTTCVPGLFAAGDASRDVQLVVVAAAEGTKAAFAINKELLAEAGLA